MPVFGITGSKGADGLTELIDFLKNKDVYEQRLSEIVAAEEKAAKVLEKYSTVENIEELLAKTQSNHSDSVKAKSEALGFANRVKEKARDDVLMLERDLGEKASALRIIENQLTEAKIELNTAKVDAVAIIMEAEKMKEESVLIRKDAADAKKEVEAKRTKLNTLLESMG